MGDVDVAAAEMMTDEDFLEAMEQMAVDEETDVGELLKAMNENQMISWEEAERILADCSNEPVKSSLPEQTRPSEPDNDTNVDRCIQQLLENDPNLKQINLNNMKRTPVPQIRRLIEALAYNEHLEKLSLANMGLYDHDAQVLVEAIKLNSNLKHLNLETNYLSGDFFSKLFEAALTNETLEEIKAVNQGVSFSTQAEKEIIGYIQKNHGLCKVSLTLRLPEGRHKIEQTTLRNGELRRILRRQKREEEERKKRESELPTKEAAPVEPKAKAPPKKITPISAPPQRAPTILAAPDDVLKVARLPRRTSVTKPAEPEKKHEPAKDHLERAKPEKELVTELVPDKDKDKDKDLEHQDKEKDTQKEKEKIVLDKLKNAQQEETKKAEIRMVVPKKKPTVNGPLTTTKTSDVLKAFEKPAETQKHEENVKEKSEEIAENEKPIEKPPPAIKVNRFKEKFEKLAAKQERQKARETVRRPAREIPKINGIREESKDRQTKEANKENGVFGDVKAKEIKQNDEVQKKETAAVVIEKESTDKPSKEIIQNEEAEKKRIEAENGETADKEKHKVDAPKVDENANDRKVRNTEEIKKAEPKKPLAKKVTKPTETAPIVKPKSDLQARIERLKQKSELAPKREVRTSLSPRPRTTGPSLSASKSPTRPSTSTPNRLADKAKEPALKPASNVPRRTLMSDKGSSQASLTPTQVRPTTRKSPSPTPTLTKTPTKTLSPTPAKTPTKTLSPTPTPTPTKTSTTLRTRNRSSNQKSPSPAPKSTARASDRFRRPLKTSPERIKHTPPLRANPV